MNKEQLEFNLKLIKDAIEKEVASGDIKDTIDKLQQLSALMGLSAECMMYSKQFVLDRQKRAYDNIDTKIAPTMFKVYLENECAEESLQYLYCERLNAALVHCSDSLVTIVSLYKTELTVSMNQR